MLDLEPPGVGDAGSIPVSVKFLSSRHQLATGAAKLRHCAWAQLRGNGPRQLVTLERVFSEYNENLIFDFFLLSTQADRLLFASDTVNLG